LVGESEVEISKLNTESVLSPTKIERSRDFAFGRLGGNSTVNLTITFY